jgi:23S rRNA pseudouridine2605 synthase
MHPSSGVLREYEVKVKGHPTRRAVAQLSKGYTDDSGHQVVPMDVSFLRRTQKNSWYRIILTEGKYHEVRRICQAAEMSVLRLVRVAYGPIELNRLPEGEVRILSGTEAHELRELGQMKRKRRILSIHDELGPPKAPK